MQLERLAGFEEFGVLRRLVVLRLLAHFCEAKQVVLDLGQEHPFSIFYTA
jgi:hypothetical protein